MDWLRKLRYEFDNLMTRGTAGLIGVLALLTLFVIVALAGVLRMFSLVPESAGGASTSLGQLVWMNFLHVLNTSTLTRDQGSWIFLALMLLVTMSGVFIFSALIGVLTTGLNERLRELRRGRSFVAEKGHTIILGGSSKIFPIISELVVANQNVRRPRVAVLAPRDPADLLSEIRSKIEDTGRTRVVVRSGDPLDVSDLEILNLNAARSIIVPSPDIQNPDFWVIRAILAILTNPKRRPQPYHIVAELKEETNVEVLALISPDEVHVVLTKDIISRLIAQTCRQSGLSTIYTELFDFEGDEIYFHAEPALVGQTFDHALLRYEDSALLGLHTAAGEVVLNPPPGTVIAAGDAVIAISEDDDTVQMSGRGTPRLDESLIRELASSAPRPERTLILGWNQKILTIARELDHYVAPGSELRIVADIAGGQAEIENGCAGLANQAVTFQQGDTTDRRLLDQIGVPTFDQVIVLCYSDDLDIQPADAKTMVTLFHLRDIADKSGQHFAVVSEILDIQNKVLAESTRADDFIVSDSVVSLILTQISENRHLGALFEDLFTPAGVEIYLKPAGDYVALGQPVDFYTVVAAAWRRHEIAFGYRLAGFARDAERDYGVVVNPVKSGKVTFEAADRLIVLAES